MEGSPKSGCVLGVRANVGKKGGGLKKSIINPKKESVSSNNFLVRDPLKLENAFGIWSAKFRIFEPEINTTPGRLNVVACITN